jgi:hypothetical protein
LALVHEKLTGSNAPAGWFINDWNLDADALAAAPDILVLRRRMVDA